MPSQPSARSTETTRTGTSGAGTRPVDSDHESDSNASVSAAAARGAAGTSSLPEPHEVMAGLRATINAPGIFSLLSPEGEYTPSEQFPLDVTPELVRGLYRDMVLVRRFDREGNALQRQGQLGLWAPLLGQEAAQVGAGRAMRPQDMAFPSYREHGVAYCRGIAPGRDRLDLPRRRLRSVEPPGEAVQQLRHRDRQPGHQRRRLGHGPAAGRRDGRRGDGGGDHRLLR